MRSIVTENGTFYNGDCISGAADYLPDNSVDLIVTDPPYGIDGHKLHRHYNRDERYVACGYVEVAKKEYPAFSQRWTREAARVLRPGGSLYVVSGYTNLADILLALRDAGLVEVNHIIWKYRFGVFTRQKFISSHYHVLFYEKPGGKRTFNLESRYGLVEKDAGSRSLNNHDREDVWAINREYKPGRAKNKNELPTELLVKMIQYSSNEGDLVADFFLGGFSTAKAAIGLNRRATGFEIASPIFDAKITEMQKIRPGFLLPAQRRPLVGNPPRAREPWTGAERRDLFDEYERLLQEGLPKKVIMAQLQERFSRGRFALEKALKKRKD